MIVGNQYIYFSDSAIILGSTAIWPEILCTMMGLFSYDSKVISSNTNINKYDNTIKSMVILNRAILSLCMQLLCRHHCIIANYLYVHKL